MKNKPIYVLGTGLSHDGSACLLKNGKVIVAIEKERITRTKHDGSNDNAAIQYCLEASGINFNDLSLIVQTGIPLPPIGPHTFYYGGPYGERIVDSNNHKVPIVSISHHLAHAYYAVGITPFDEMAILVVDGSGQEMRHCIDLQGAVIPETIPERLAHLFYETDSFYSFKDGKLTTLYKDFSYYNENLLMWTPMFPRPLRNSIGNMYEAVSLYCMGGVFDTGKLMGLAPYGRPGVYTGKIFELKDGRVFVREDWQKEFDKPNKNYQHFKDNFQYYADIAYWMQKEFERAMLYIIHERSRLCNAKNLAYTGGVALNAVFNARILSNSPFEQLFVTPAAGDNGLGIGCAFYGWLEVIKGGRIKHDGNSCFGKIYTQDEIMKTISTFTIHKNDTEIINRFFEMLANCIFEEKMSNSCTVQFIIKEVGMFALEFKGQKCAVIMGGAKSPNGTITLDGKAFIEWVHYLDIVNLERRGSVKMDGNISSILHIQECFKTKSLDSFIKNIISKNDMRSEEILYSEERDVVKTTAELLSKGNVIAWFQEGSEFGPRALGHRSILADPRRKDIQKFINDKVKFREDFRPFAPSVLLEDVSKYFQFEGESPYMLMVARVQPEWKDRIPGVVHKDDSCRVQTVTPDWNNRFYRLIEEFRNRTGLGVLLNTSLNRKGMPIVETPEQALSFFYECDLDCLVLGDYVIYKKNTPGTARPQPKSV